MYYAFEYIIYKIKNIILIFEGTFQNCLREF